MRSLIQLPCRSTLFYQFLFLLWVLSASAQISGQAPPAQQAVQKKLYFVTEVVDGDTIKLSNGETVRLVGVDTPETVHPTKPVEAFGREASAFTKHLLLGKQVRLEFDQDTRDRYKRLLAYVYLPDGSCANEQIIASGYGYAYTQFPFKYMARYKELEKTARTQRKGLWAGDSSAATSIPSVIPAASVPAFGMVPSRFSSVSPPSDQLLVAITPTGKKYHALTCRTVTASTARQIPFSHATAAGYAPCKICN